MSGIKNTLQFGDSKGNIFHKENLGTHVAGDSLTEIPPSTTSSSGNYHFKPEGVLQIANFSGGQTGGVEFWNGSTTEPPKKLLSIKRDGITCEKINTESMKVNQDLNFISNYPVGIECAFNENTFTTGILAQNKDSADASSVSILLTNNLGTDSAYYGGLTMFSSNTVPAYGFPSIKNAISLNSQSSSVVISPWNGQQHGTADENGNIIFTYNGGSNAHIINNYGQLILGADNPDYSGMTYGGDNGGTDSVLTSDGTNGLKWSKTLTFDDGVDKSVLSSTNLTFNDIPYTRNMVNSSLIYSSAAIYADSNADSTYPPATNLLIRNTFGYNGWAFINTASGSKFNYFFSLQSPNTTLADIKGVTFNYFNETQTSNDYQIFCTIYTIPQSGDTNFYHSKRNYIFDQTITPTINTAYQACVLVDKSLVSYYSETQIQYELDTLNQVGPFLPDEKILAITLSSDSSCPTASMSVVLSKICIIMDSFTKEGIFICP